MTDTAPMERPTAFKSSALSQAVLYACVMGILYWLACVMVGPSVGQTPTAVAYLGGFAIIAILSFASWRWTEYAFACLLGLLLSIPTNATMSGGTTDMSSFPGLIFLSAVVMIPTLLFLLPRFMRWVDERSAN